MATKLINASISPDPRMGMFSHSETQQLREETGGRLAEIFRLCSLAVLNCGEKVDNAKAILEQYSQFEIKVVPQSGGIRLDLFNAPENAFVDGQMIRGIREHLFAVLRDVVFVNSEIVHSRRFDLSTSEGITNAVFSILRNARVIGEDTGANVIVCWGGHSISRVEYEFTKEVGHELGLRGFDICTGCGPGAMKGPMKGATIGHAKQRMANGRYIGITEPGIIAAESPNPIVNQLTIMPDIEKRLEAFVRVAHGIIVFPGGVGTAEEILYLLGILLDPANKQIPFPLIFAAPHSSKDYFKEIDHFLVTALGEDVRKHYEIIVGDPELVAQRMLQHTREVRGFRQENTDAFYFNWMLHTDKIFQVPFHATHSAMSSLELHHHQSPHLLAANLRRAFSGLVSGNVKAQGMKAIQEHGPFEIRGEPQLMNQLDHLLHQFVAQNRMKIDGGSYKPCYRVIT
ncbi:MAG TPA: nucleotide 5'-monophosphate nucleosidase PpnN [Pseudomonadales bacterium]|nr:nucleotide 5'-monophosphate nucleosidase PpnN [Pseudomonadales bacterium]